MPLYEYECQACRHRFERLVRPPVDSAAIGTCPSCNSPNLERLISSFSAQSEATRRFNLSQGRKALDKKLREKKHAEAEESAHHHH